MIHRLALLLGALALSLAGTAAWAQAGGRVVARVTWVEEWDPARGHWVQVPEEPAGNLLVVDGDGGPTSGDIDAPAGHYGPFRLIDARRAGLVGTTDAASPGAFRAMLAAHPDLEVIEFIDAPGTSDDLANLALGRAIRAAGLATHVPDGGSARSGAVELFLAGARRSAAPGARFAVHAWRDGRGREPADLAADAPEHRLYLDYYAEMGMSREAAHAFYAMTNSVPHESVLWLGAAAMAHWLGALGHAPPAAAPRLAYGADAGLLDSGAAFP